MNGILPHSSEFVQACASIKKEAMNQSKVDINPLFTRISVILDELMEHVLLLSSDSNDSLDEKYHWSVLYRAGDVLGEMATMLTHTTPLPIRTEVQFIMQILIFYTQIVIQRFGKREALYIITPKFQELADLW